MRVYEVTLPGFDGSADETDHLIKWVVADKLGHVLEAYLDAEVIPLSEVSLNDPGIDEVLGDRFHAAQ